MQHPVVLKFYCQTNQLTNNFDYQKIISSHAEA